MPYTATDTDYVLTAEDIDNLTELGDLIEDQPDIVDATLRKYGVEPSADPGIKALQLIEAGQSSADFDADLASEAEVLGFSFKLPKIRLPKIGKIFGKKGGGGKVGSFFKNLFKGKKRVLAEATAKIAAGQPLTAREQRVYDRAQGGARGTPPPYIDAAALAASAALAGREETPEDKKKREEAEAKKKKDEQNMMIAGAVIIILIIGFFIWRANR